MKIKENKSGSIMLLDDNEVLQHILPKNYYVHKHPTIYNAVLISSSSDNMDVQNGIVVRLSEVTQIGNDTFKISLSSLMKKLNNFSTKIYPKIKGMPDEYGEFLVIKNYEEFLSFGKKYGKKHEFLDVSGNVSSVSYSCKFSKFKVRIFEEFKYFQNSTVVLYSLIGYVLDFYNNEIPKERFKMFKDVAKLYNYDTENQLKGFFYGSLQEIAHKSFISLKNVDELLSFAGLWVRFPQTPQRVRFTDVNSVLFNKVKELYYQIAFKGTSVEIRFYYTYYTTSNLAGKEKTLAVKILGPEKNVFKIPFEKHCKQFNYDANGKLTSTEYINC